MKCIVCEKETSGSMGGPTICPSCDCGITVIIGGYVYKRIGRAPLSIEQNELF